MPGLSCRLLVLALLAASGTGCGGNGEVIDPPDPPVLTTLRVTPDAVALFTLAPGNAVTLTVDGFDQQGDRMTGTPTFVSSNDAVATVGSDGRIAAVGPGIAEVTTSLTIGGVTKTVATEVTVQVAAATAAVIAPGFDFQPGTVDVSSGGEVTWSFAAITHTVTFTTPGAPANVPEFSGGSAARVFPASGTYNYRCTIHAAMTGVVRVH